MPESALTKKHNSVNFHVVQEVAVVRMLQVRKEGGTTNLVDALMEVMATSERWQKELCQCAMHQTED